jgi:hypothetical protein
MVISNANNSIPVPRGITVLRVQPASVILSLDKLIQKHFPVKPVISGKIAAGYVLKSMKMDPEVITITGPQTILSQLDELRTHDIVIEGLSESQQRQVPLKLKPEIVDLIGETSVTASLQVVQETVRKTIYNVPVVAIADGVQQQVLPGKVTVTANVPKSLVKEKNNLKSLFTVTVSDVLDDGRLKVTIIPREDVRESLEILSVEPDHVEMVKEKKEVPVKRSLPSGERQNNGASSDSGGGQAGTPRGVEAEKQEKVKSIMSDKTKIKTERQ